MSDTSEDKSLVQHQVAPEIVELTKTIHVLVVDDSRTLRKLLIRELSAIGITNITEAENGVEAIEKARAKSNSHR